MFQPPAQHVIISPSEQISYRTDLTTSARVSVLRCTCSSRRASVAGPAEERLLWSCSALAKSACSLGGAAARGPMGLALGQAKLGGESLCGCGAQAHRKAQPPRRPRARLHQARSPRPLRPGRAAESAVAQSGARLPGWSDRFGLCFITLL